MNIIKYKKIFISIAVLLTALSIFSMVFFGFKFGIDFKGGTSINVDFKSLPSQESIDAMLNTTFPDKQFLSTKLGGSSYEFKTVELTSSEVELLKSSIGNSFADSTVTSVTTIGPSVGRELARKSIVSIILVALGIVVFIGLSFRRVSEPVKSWKYGVIAIVTLLHDVIIPTGIFVILSHIYNIEIDTLFVVSLLTILGLSVSDTIVVFDRIRENLKISKDVKDFANIVNKSINEVYKRSIATGLSVILALVALSIWGPASTRLLSVMLGAGMLFGTYSSIFLASPLLVVWKEYQDKKALKTKNS